MRTDEARGLLWLMEEEALQPGGSEETLLGRLFSYYGPAEGESKGKGKMHTHTYMHKVALIQIVIFSEMNRKSLYFHFHFQKE